VHRNNIRIYIQQDATLHSSFYLETAVHISGGTSTHHQERKQLYLQHLVFIATLLPPAAFVEELQLVWVCCGWRTPPTAHSNNIAHSIICTRLFRGKMHSNCFNGIEILQGGLQHGEKWDTVIPADMKIFLVSGIYMSHWSRKC